MKYKLLLLRKIVTILSFLSELHDVNSQLRATKIRIAKKSELCENFFCNYLETNFHNKVHIVAFQKKEVKCSCLSCCFRQYSVRMCHHLMLPSCRVLIHSSSSSRRRCLQSASLSEGVHSLTSVSSQWLSFIVIYDVNGMPEVPDWIPSVCKGILRARWLLAWPMGRLHFSPTIQVCLWFHLVWVCYLDVNCTYGL